MSRSPAPLDLSSSEDHECHCLGYAAVPHPQQYFLSQHKSLEIKNKPSPTHTSRHEDPMHSIKNSGKRSLRKNFRMGYESPVTARTIEPLQEYYSQKKIVMPKQEYERGNRVEPERRSINFIKPEKTEKISESKPIEPLFARNNRQTVSGWQQIMPNAFYVPPPATVSPRLLISHTQPPPIKINFSHSPPPANSHRYSPLISPRDFTQIEREESRRPPVLSDLKEELRISIGPTPIKEALPSRREMDRGSHEDIDFELT
jgi:hypothetical protein